MLLFLLSYIRNIRVRALREVEIEYLIIFVKSLIWHSQVLNDDEGSAFPHPINKLCEQHNSKRSIALQKLTDMPINTPACINLDGCGLSALLVRRRSAIPQIKAHG